MISSPQAETSRRQQKLRSLAALGAKIIEIWTGILPHERRYHEEGKSALNHANSFVYIMRHDGDPRWDGDGGRVEVQQRF